MPDKDLAISPITPPAGNFAGEPEKEMEILAERIAMLDPEAFVEFAHDYGKRLFRFFFRHGLPETDAEVLAFDTVKVVLLKINQYRPKKGGSFNAWVFRIARNKLIDWYRSKKITGVIDGKITFQLDKVPDNLASDHNQPISEEAELPSETTQAVYDGLAKLSAKDREIILLKYIDSNLDNDELAIRLNIKTNAAKTRLSRALKRLKMILEKDPRIKIRKKEI